MAAYPTAPLRDVCASVEYGYTASSTPDASVGPRFLRITDIVPERLDWESVPFCAIEPKKLAKHRLRTGDIVIARTGATTGWAKYIKEPPEAVFASYLVRVRPASSVDARYLGFVVESSIYKDFIQQHMGGAAQPNANAQVLTSFDVPLPPLPLQRCIAGILSAYDELIENSQRRIKILESMARALYREWFVHFRFPGHESVPRVSSPLGDIPQGWEVKPFTEIAAVLSGGTPKTAVAEYWNGEIPFFTPRDASDCFYVQDTDKHVTELGLSKCTGELYPPDTVFITARGTVGKVSLPSVPMAMNQSCYALRGREKISQHYLFLLTRQQVDYLKTNTGGATFDTIVVDTFRRMQVVKPSSEIIARFTAEVEAMFEQLKTLQRQSHNLRSTRDLLLPRLLSGQIEVEAISS